MKKIIDLALSGMVTYVATVIAETTASQVVEVINHIKESKKILSEIEEV